MLPQVLEQKNDTFPQILPDEQRLQNSFPPLGLFIIPSKLWVFPKMGYPLIIHFQRIYQYKPSILGYPD